MRIEVTPECVSLDAEGYRFNAAQLGQLHFWGYEPQQEPGWYRCETKDPAISLLKLTDYFSSDSVPFTLAESAERLLSDLRTSSSKLTALMDKAARYKNGESDEATLGSFVRFAKRHIARPLRDHQLKAAFHLTILGNGANFSVPGSGKTAVVLTFFEWLRLAGKVNTLVVIGPPSCFGPWKTEFRDTLGRVPKVATLAGGDQSQRKAEYYRAEADRADLYLTTFQTLLNDEHELTLLLSSRGTSSLLVIDEAHYVKQLNGAWASAVLRVGRYATFRCVLTGTPMPRSYTDVFNMMDFLWPKVPPLAPDTKLRIQILEQENRADQVKEILDQHIGPLTYRVRKSDLGLTEPVFHPPIVIPMKENERTLYDAVLTRIKHYSKEDYVRNIELVRRLCRGRITRLRQCVSYAKLLQSSLLDYDEQLVSEDSRLYDILSSYDSLETPAKIDGLLSLLNEMWRRGEKAVIWSNFRGSLKLISDTILRHGHRCEMIYGDTPTESTPYSEERTREQIRDEFVSESSGLDILVANPAACAESISLHRTCHNAVYYDLSYNCAQYLQSLDRIHRVGGSETTYAHYYFLQYADSIDQDILDNLRRKAARMYAIIEQDFPVYSLDMFEDDDTQAAYERLFRS